MKLSAILFHSAILAYRLAPLGFVASLGLLFINRRKRQLIDVLAALDVPRKSPQAEQPEAKKERA